MPEACLKLCQISKMTRHIESLNIVKTVYPSIFRYIQGRLAIFSLVQANSGALRYIEAYSGILKVH